MTSFFRALFLLSIFFVLTAEKCTTPETVRAMTVNEQFHRDNTDRWAKVDSLEEQGLYKSALKVVEDIYVFAEKDKDANEQVKAMLYKLKFAGYIEEDALFKAISEMENVADSSYYPVEPIVHSILAESYWGYYQSNRYKILNRTQTAEMLDDDIRTWDLDKLVAKVFEHYQASLRPFDKLSITPVDSIKPLLVDKEVAQKVRPTLYDLLAHRAIDLYQNSETGLARPAQHFELQGAKYFSLFEDFAFMPIGSKDTTAMEYQAIKGFQRLTRMHVSDNDGSALGPLELERLKFVRAHSTHQDKDSLYLNALMELANPMLEEAVWAEVQHAIALYWEEQGNKYKPLKSADHKWEKNKAIEICEMAIEKFPSSIGARNCEVLIERIRSKSLNAEVEEVNAPDLPFRVSLHYKNTEKLWYRIYKDDREEGNMHNYGEGKLKELLKMTARQDGTFEPPLDGDNQQHRVEVKVNGLSYGKYILLIADREDFDLKKGVVASSDFWVSDLTFLPRGKVEGGFEIMVLSRTSGEPVEGAKVEASQYDRGYGAQQWKTLSERMTNKEGIATIPEIDAMRLRFKVSKNGDEFSSSKDFYNHNRGPLETPNVRTRFFLDRAIYRPGQRVYFKGIVLEHSSAGPRVMSDHKEIVTFYDANGQSVEEQNVATNRYGTYHGSFIAPMGGLTGQMRLKSEYGQIRFRVEEYKRPRFEVTMDPVEGAFKLDEKIKVTGKAMSYSGAALNDAEVRYYVRREARFPWYRWSRPWFPSPRSERVELKNGAVKTKADGSFEIEFQAIADKSIPKRDRPVFDYSIYVEVIDLTGETHSANSRVSVGYGSMELIINVPGLLEVNNTDTFFVGAQNLNGQPIEASGTIKVHRLEMPDKTKRPRWWMQPDTFLLTKEEFETSFPIDEYDDSSDVRNWPVGKTVYSGEFRSKEVGFRPIDLKNWPIGKYKLVVESVDPFDQKVKDEHYFTVIDGTSKKLPEPKVFWSRFSKDVAEPGDVIEAWVGSQEDLSVLYEIENKGKVIHTERFELNSELKKVSIPIEESHRGDIAVHFIAIKNNRVFRVDQRVTVPWTNKMLDLSFETFRDKLRPGSEEEWRIKINGPKGEKVVAEMVAAMYDASLDTFAPNDWDFNVQRNFAMFRSWGFDRSFNVHNTRLLGEGWNNWMGDTVRVFDRLNMFGFNNRNWSYRFYGAGGYANGVVMYNQPMMDADMVTQVRAEKAEVKAPISTAIYEWDDEDSAPAEVTPRKNLQETAFFFPDLMTDADGSVILKFTMPEALTRWKFLALAHTQDVKTALITKEVVTQKELMVTPNVPRFVRKGDKILLSAKVSNLSGEFMEGAMELRLFDALTNEPADQLLKNANPIRDFNVEEGQSTAKEWSIEIPEKFDAIVYRFIARAGKFTDAEEGVLPVISNRMLVTETMPLPIRKAGTKSWTFDKLLASDTLKTLKHHKLTLEFTANPIWYAIQALPYMMEYPHDCSEQVFTRFYANSIASYVVSSNPKIKAVFDHWQRSSPESFLSELEKNQELKALVLEETPWVLDAQEQSERKKRVALLFDVQRMRSQLGTALNKLKEKQNSSGAWPWFAGMQDSRYITQHIVTGMGHLKVLDVFQPMDDDRTRNMLLAAIGYLDSKVLEDYHELTEEEREKSEYISARHIQYLYARSFFTDVTLGEEVRTAFTYYKNKAAENWLKQGLQLQAMTAIAMHRWDESAKANSIMASLKERAIVDDEMGMHWKEFYAGYSWHQMPVETHALMIEAFEEITNDIDAVNDLRTFLIKQKQTTDWKTTKATADACYALMLRGDDWLTDTEMPKITMGGTVIDTKDPDLKKESGTGYFETSWSGGEIRSEMGNVSITKGKDGVAWGAMYWQYFEDLDKITHAETPLQLTKKLFVEKRSDTGPILFEISDTTEIAPGDLIKVRVELRADRDMEFIHMKDMRAAGTEPLNVLSQYKWQGGIGYYESTKDASTNFFIDHLRKGTYVFEYPVRVTHKGNMSNGITTIQSMYAPEFSAHSKGVRIEVDK